jgi:hypothetical protein
MDNQTIVKGSMHTLRNWVAWLINQATLNQQAVQQIVLFTNSPEGITNYLEMGNFPMPSTPNFDDLMRQGFAVMVDAIRQRPETIEAALSFHNRRLAFEDDSIPKPDKGDLQGYHDYSQAQVMSLRKKYGEDPLKWPQDIWADNFTIAFVSRTDEEIVVSQAYSMVPDPIKDDAWVAMPDDELLRESPQNYGPIATNAIRALKKGMGIHFD